MQWYGVMGPAKMPVEITKKLNAEVNKALASPTLRERLSGEAIEPMPMTPEQFGEFIKADIARWKRLPTSARFQWMSSAPPERNNA